MLIHVKLNDQDFKQKIFFFNLKTILIGLNQLCVKGQMISKIYTEDHDIYTVNLTNKVLFPLHTHNISTIISTIS